MKRFLSGLLCVCILLSGCAGGSPQPTQTDPPETQTQPSAPAVPLLEQGIAVGESGNLLYIPNDAVEDMICPEVRLFGNGLLLSAYVQNQYVLRHISLEDGALLSECAIPASPGVKVRIGSGCIGLLDSGTNRVHLLDMGLLTIFSSNWSAGFLSRTVWQTSLAMLLPSCRSRTVISRTLPCDRPAVALGCDGQNRRPLR